MTDHVEETMFLPLKIHPAELVYQDRCQKVSRTVVEFRGFQKEYFVSDRGQRSAVLVVRDEKVLLVRQYRFLINKLSYEIPGGRVDDKESPDVTAARECEEETGIRCSNLKLLLDYHPGLDSWKNYTHIFYTSEFHDVTLGADLARRHWMSLRDCITMIANRQIVDSLSIISLLTYNTLILTASDAT